ncbi:MAG: hypothetical protein WCF84_02295 [Anaerolineae bacterium]
MTRLQVLTPWVPASACAWPERCNHPQIADDYTLASWADVTSQPATNITPNPNLLTVEAVCADTVAASIEGDSKYLVLWSEAA